MIATLILAALLGQSEPNQEAGQSITMRGSDEITQRHIHNLCLRHGWDVMFARSTFDTFALTKPVRNLREVLQVEAPQESFDIGVFGPEGRRQIGWKANPFEEATVMARDIKGGFINAPFDVKSVASALKKEKSFVLDGSAVVSYIARPYLEKPDKYAIGFEVFIRSEKEMFRLQVCNNRVVSLVEDYP